ncbi:MAG: hypothetical protein ACLQU2_35205 [Candidatus Binataceae bacterium]
MAIFSRMAEGLKDAHARLVLKRFGAQVEAMAANSESQGGQQNASPNTSGKTILNQGLEKSQGHEEERQNLFQFPNVARELKARARRLRSEIERSPPWVEDPDAQELMAVSFIMLEDELISTNRIKVPAGDERTFGQLCARRATREGELIIEHILAEYRELVPGGGAATEQQLLELGVDGMIAAVKKQRSGIGGKDPENDVISTNRNSVPAGDKRTFGQLSAEQELLIEQLRARYRELVPGGWAATEQEVRESGVDGIIAAAKRQRSGIGGKESQRSSCSRARNQKDNGRVHRDRPEQLAPNKPATK